MVLARLGMIRWSDLYVFERVIAVYFAIVWLPVLGCVLGVPSGLRVVRVLASDVVGTGSGDHRGYWWAVRDLGRVVSAAGFGPVSDHFWWAVLGVFVYLVVGSGLVGFVVRGVFDRRLLAAEEARRRRILGRS
jgi:hypothetical protein